MKPAARAILDAFKDRGLVAGGHIHLADFGDAIRWKNGDVGEAADEETYEALEFLIDKKYVREQDGGLVLTEKGLGSILIDLTPLTYADWERVCYHEAGHSVVSLVLKHPPRPTVLRCEVVQSRLQAQGTYQLPSTLAEGASPFDLVQRLAAGGVAEEICYGHYTYGVTGDHSKIDEFLKLRPEPASLNERTGNYPATRSILTANWPAVVRIAEITLRRFMTMNLSNIEFPNTPVLSANAVNRIFCNPQLTEQERADAQLASLAYALQRGNGSKPEYHPDAANDDFCKAAGDILGAIP